MIKKILSGIFASIIISVFLMNNIIFAQSAVKTKDNQKAEDMQTVSSAVDVGINFAGSCLDGVWKWCMNMQKVLWMDSQPGNMDALSIAQDVIFAATYMVWTILTIVIIYCGLMFIFASRDGKDVSQYKKWLIYAAIWAILVRWAYAIVRLIQYIAKW